MARDPAELARQLRPADAAPACRVSPQGTAFHQWLEQRYGQQAHLTTPTCSILADQD